MPQLSRPLDGPLRVKQFGRVAKVGALWGFFRESVGQIIEIPGSIALARLLSPHDFGIAAAAGLVLRFANKIGGLGLGGALVRIRELRPEHISTVLVVNLAAGVCIWAALTAVAPLVGTFFGAPEVTRTLRFAALIYLILPFGAGQLALIHRQLRFREAAFVGWIYSIVFFAVAVPLAWLGYGYWSLIYGQFVANVVQTLTKIRVGGSVPRLRFSRQAFNETIPFGLGLYSKRLLAYAAEYSDTLLVGRFFGMSALGFYDKGFNAMNQITGRLSYGPNVFLRIFSVIQDEPERFRRAYYKVVLSVSLIGFPVFAAVTALASDLIVVVYGAKWQPAVLPFQLLCVTAAFRLLNNYASAAAQAKGLIWSEVWRSVLYVVLLIVAVAAFRQQGIAGAAFGVSLTTAIMALLMQTLICRITLVTWKDVVAASLPGVVIALAVWSGVAGVRFALMTAIADIAQWKLLLSGTASAALIYLGLVLFGPFGEVRELVDEVVDDFAPSLRRFLPWATGLQGQARDGARKSIRTV